MLKKKLITLKIQKMLKSLKMIMKVLMHKKFEKTLKPISNEFLLKFLIESLIVFKKDYLVMKIQINQTKKKNKSQKIFKKKSIKIKI